MGSSPIGTGQPNVDLFFFIHGTRIEGMMWNVVIGGMGVSPERGLAREQELKSTDQFWGRK